MRDGGGGDSEDEASGLLSSPTPRGSASGERQGLLTEAETTTRQPQNMGGDVDVDVDDVEPARWRPAKRRRSLLRSRACQMVLMVLAVAAIVLGFIGAYLNSASSRTTTIIESSNQPLKSQASLGNPEPSDPPPQLQNQQTQLQNQQPPMQYPPFDGEIIFPVKSACALGKVVNMETYPFITGDTYPLVFTQTIEGENQPQPGSLPVKVYGDVLVRRTTGTPEIVIEVQSNDDGVRIGQKWDSRAQRLILSAPSRVQGRTQSPCLHIRATISLPKGARLNTIKVEAMHLNIQLLDNLDLGVLKTAELTTTVGSVACAAATRNEDDLARLIRDGAPPFFRFEARSVSVSATSGPISGAWPFYDYLRLETLSGKLKVGIEPKPVQAADPRVATLVIRSTSGDIEIWEPVQQARQALLAQQDAAGNGLAPQGMARSAAEILPPREYDINVGTTSGDIKGELAFSYAAKLHSTSGGITVDLLPVLPAELGILAGVAAEDQRQSSLQTTSTSGNIVVKVLEPFWWNAATAVYSTAVEGAAGRVPPPPVTPPRPGTAAPEDPDRGLVVPVGGGPGDLTNVPSGPPAFLTPPAVGPPSIGRRAPQQLQTAEGAALDRQQAQAAAMGVPKYLRTLQSRHSTTSAAVGVRYPSSWRGDIDVTNMSGRVKVWGKDVVILDQTGRRHGANRHISARKGAQEGGDASSMVAQSMSGKIDVGVGKKV